jgi:alpha-tubulin suppressor-like RCC1 family protein
MSLASSKTVGSAVSKDGSAKKLQYEMLPIGLSKTRFLRVACSMFGAIAIAEDGSLHYWTLDSDGLIYTEGGPVPKLEGVTVVDIAAGHDHYLAVTVDGDLFAWGSNQFFQCTPEPVTRVYTPTKVSTKHVLACSAGGHSSLVIDAEGVAFTWGKAEISVTIPVAPATASSTPSSTEHQERPRTKPTHQTIIVDSLGHGEAQTSFRGSSLYVREPTMVALPEQAQFLQASMSSTMTILVSREGKVYAWGDANAIAASTPDAFSSTPVPIPFPKGVRIVRALAGDYHALALDASGHLWTWGGRFIGGSADPALTNSEPRRITFGKSDDVVVDFGMSQDISSALTSSSELWTWDHPSASPLRADSVSGETAVGVSHGTSSHTLFVLFGSQQASSRSASTSDLPRSQSTIYDSSNDFDISLDEDEANSLLDTLTDEFVTPQ